MKRAFKLRGLLLGLLLIVVSTGTQAGEAYFHPFHEGLALVEIDSQRGAWNGFIDRNGQWVIKPVFEGFHNMQSYFSDGLALAQLNEKDGYIDHSGKWVIEPQFEHSYKFSDGLALAKSNGKYGYINKKGQWAINAQFDEAEPFHDGVALVKKGDVRSYMDKTGKGLIISSNPGLQHPQPFSEGLAVIDENGKSGYIDHQGKWVYKPVFTYAHDFSDGLAQVTLNDESGYIDHNGKWVIKLQAYSADDFSEGLARVRLSAGDKYGYIDHSGKWMIKPQFDTNVEGEEGIFSEGLAVAGLSGETGYIDRKGKWAISPKKLQTLVAPYVALSEKVDAEEIAAKEVENKPQIKACVPPKGASQQYSDDCVNGDCVRTYSNGCQKRIQAAHCYDPGREEWVWKPDGC